MKERQNKRAAAEFERVSPTRCYWVTRASTKYFARVKEREKLLHSSSFVTAPVLLSPIPGNFCAKIFARGCFHLQRVGESCLLYFVKARNKYFAFMGGIRLLSPRGRRDVLPGKAIKDSRLCRLLKHTGENGVLHSHFILSAVSSSDTRIK